MDTNKIRIQQIIYLFIIIFTISSCSPFLTKSYNKGNRKPYIEFFVETGINQYFLKPQKFCSIATKSKDFLTIDFTFRDTMKSNSPATVNTSIYTQQPVAEIDSIILKYDNYTALLKNCKKLFIKKHKKYYEIRYSCRLDYGKILDYFAHQKYQILASYNNSIYRFEPTKKTTKNFAIFNEDVIELIKLNTNQ